MVITEFDSDSAVLAELGQRLAQIRLARNISQSQLAEEAGVSRATVERLENGSSIAFASVVRIVRSLGLLELISDAITPPTVGPFDAFKSARRHRRRATGARGRMPIVVELPPWPEPTSGAHR
jgi:transcriptional regulator with XRE-family HTH domain